MLWFNFQISDVIHGQYKNMEEEEEELTHIKLDHQFDWSHAYLIGQDFLLW